MRKTKEITVFGFTYRMTQLAASSAFDRIQTEETTLFPMLETVSIDGVILDNKKVVNEKVKDKLGIMQPRTVLDSLMFCVDKFNFEFLESRKAPRMPSYLRSPDDSPKHESDTSPIMALLISEGKATLKELEEYYSLEDAFKMYDIIFADKLNQAEAYHSASKRR